VASTRCDGSGRRSPVRNCWISSTIASASI